MAKVTSKLQVTIPKRIAEDYGIEPGDEIEFVPAGDGIRVVTGDESPALSIEERLELFDAATARQRDRERGSRRPAEKAARKRGWTRTELYDRGRAD
jgi:AbrB family looped-hinge helix DNA binding protein